MTLRTESLDKWGERLRSASSRVATEFPGEGPDRQPVHTVYGGAHLFRADTAGRLGSLALKALEEWCNTPEDLADLLDLDIGLAGQVHSLVKAKLEREPVEDFRLDFEDGYGNRPDDEEDGHASSAALEVAAGMEANSLPPFIGVRIKPLSGELHKRALRTLDVFITTLAEKAGRLPEGFAVTLPKIQDPEQVAVLAEAMATLEDTFDIPQIPIELMVETPQMVIDSDGSAGLRK